MSSTMQLSRPSHTSSPISMQPWQERYQSWLLHGHSNVPIPSECGTQIAQQGSHLLPHNSSFL